MGRPGAVIGLSLLLASGALGQSTGQSTVDSRQPTVESSQSVLRPPTLLVEDRGRPGAAAEIRAIPKEPLAALVEMFGLVDPGPPVRVIVAGEGSEEARSAPSWMSGYAKGDAGVVVLLVDRTPSYPDGSLVEVLYHELAHVLLYRASRGGNVPRWFNEGVAMLAGRSFTLSDESRFAFELVTAKKTSVYDLDPLFAGDRASVRRAYALSGALVADLVETHGSGLPRAVLSRVARGVPFERAFLEVTGRTLDDVDQTFWSRQTLIKRWIPILMSGTVLWFLISVLALLAIRRRRKLDRQQHARWENEEREEVVEVDEQTLDPDDEDPPTPPPPKEIVN